MSMLSKIMGSVREETQHAPMDRLAVLPTIALRGLR